MCHKGWIGDDCFEKYIPPPPTSPKRTNRTNSTVTANRSSTTMFNQSSNASVHWTGNASIDLNGTNDTAQPHTVDTKVVPNRDRSNHTLNATRQVEYISPYPDGTTCSNSEWPRIGAAHAFVCARLNRGILIQCGRVKSSRFVWSIRRLLE